MLGKASVSHEFLGGDPKLEGFDCGVAGVIHLDLCTTVHET